MDAFKTLIVILLSSVLVNNYVLNRFLGICPFLGVSKKLDQSVGMGISVTAVMLLATAVTWPIQHFILNTLGLGYMQTIIFILVIAALVQMLELLLKKFSPALHKSLGVYLPLITTNCAVLGVAINNINDNYNFLQSMVSSLGCGLGFLLAMVLRRTSFTHRRKQRSQALPRTCSYTDSCFLYLFGIYGIRRYRRQSVCIRR